MDKTSQKGVTLKSWIRDRVVFLALIIFGSGAAMYIGSSKIFPLDSIWLHPVKEFSLLVSMIAVISIVSSCFS